MASFQLSQVTLLYWAHLKTAEWNVSLQMFFPSQSWRLSEWAAHHSIEFNKGWITAKCHFLLISLSLKVIHPLSLMLVVWGGCSAIWNCSEFLLSCYSQQLCVFFQDYYSSFEGPIKTSLFKELAPFGIHDLWILLLLIFIESVFISIPISSIWVMILWFGLRNYRKIFSKND